MSILDDIYKAYKQSNLIRINVEHPTNPQHLRFGDIIEIYNPIFVLAVYVGDDQALLMSNFWELGMNTDLVVEFNHTISNKWIIEIDKSIFITSDICYLRVSRLSTEDKNLLKNVLNGDPIPPEKSGPKVPFNPKDPRYKFKKNEAEKTLKFNRKLFYEE